MNNRPQKAFCGWSKKGVRPFLVKNVSRGHFQGKRGQGSSPEPETFPPLVGLALFWLRFPGHGVDEVEMATILLAQCNPAHLQAVHRECAALGLHMPCAVDSAFLAIKYQFHQHRFNQIFSQLFQ